MTDKDILALIGTLTLEEKASLCGGMDYWTTPALPHRGIPAMRMADGPHGVRRECKPKGNVHSLPATCFPPQVTLACSWSPELVSQVGHAIAQECIDQGVHMILGPGVNIKRSPLGGRNFEYYSEDPLLSGLLAAGFIRGVQQNGVGTSLKHFAVNNQEYKRMSISAEIDERALFELYLKPFEIAIKESQPATVMCSYNRVLGEYASESRRLLTDILRIRFGFAGAVISDWGAVNDRVKALAAGMDLEMPSSGGAGAWAIVQAVQQGTLSEDVLDTACWNLLRMVFACTQPVSSAACSYTQHHTLAAQALCKSAVLLKNEGLLPLKPQTSIAVIGQMAAQPRYQGGGSSAVHPAQLVGFTGALSAAGIPYQYALGYSAGKTSAKLLRQAVQTAKTAETVLLFLGLPDAYECEGFDRKHLQLPACQVQLLQKVAQVNPNVCVVLCCGSPVETPWLPQVKSLLCLHLGGEALGEATLSLLYGQAIPSGKLAESWPLHLDDVPSTPFFPMGPQHVSYNESIYVGYRYYNTADIPLQFPFGYGLSYTSFAYRQLSLVSVTVAAGKTICMQVSIENTGKYEGDEIVQVYIRRPAAGMWQPAHSLVAFGRVTISPGNTATLSLEVPYERLGYYHPAVNAHIVETGEYELQVGPHSRNLPLRATLQVQGVRPPPPYLPKGTYWHIKDNNFSTAEYAQLCPRALLENHLPQKGAYTYNTPLGEMTGSFWGRRIKGLARAVARLFIHFSADKTTNLHAANNTAADLPLRGIIYHTAGRASPQALRTLLNMCNGQGGFRKLIAQVIRRPVYQRNKHKRR